MKGLQIFNGVIFSLDSKYFFYSDTPKQIIYRCDFNPKTSEITNRLEYLKVENGYPDGATIDSEGNIYWAIIKGKRITPREWFVVPFEEIERAIELILNEQIVNYKYDKDNEKIVLE